MSGGPIAHIEWTYAPLVLVGLLVILMFRPTAQYTADQRRDYLRIQVITVIGAVLGAKLAVLFGDVLWPLRPVEDWRTLLVSGRSIVGALLFGFLAAELAKPVLRYPLPPNDRFAVVLPFSIGLGRIGCWFSGCCLGLPTDSFWAMTGPDGVGRFPSAWFEFTFHILAGITLAVLYRRRMFGGRLFAIYLLLYGTFRFGSEFLRVTVKAFGGLSAYQWLSLALILAGVLALWLRRPPARPLHGANA